MEFKDLGAEVEWEARCVAAAFGVEKWSRSKRQGKNGFRGRLGELVIGWCIGGNEEYDLVAGHSYIAIYPRDAGETLVGFTGKKVMRKSLSRRADVNVMMARGLYLLGLEDEGALSPLPPLTAHEKLELRLSLPREFWPKTWLDEEGEQSS